MVESMHSHFGLSLTLKIAYICIHKAVHWTVYSASNQAPVPWSQHYCPHFLPTQAPIFHQPIFCHRFTPRVERPQSLFPANQDWLPQGSFLSETPSLPLKHCNNCKTKMYNSPKLTPTYLCPRCTPGLLSPPPSAVRPQPRDWRVLGGGGRDWEFVFRDLGMFIVDAIVRFGMRLWARNIKPGENIQIKQ